MNEIISLDYVHWTCFCLGEKLPWVTKAVISIYNYAPSGSAKKRKELKRRKDPVNGYVKSLIELWSKAFRSENIMERTAVANKIRNGFALYFNNVYNRQSQEQEWLKKWRQLPEVNQPLDILKKTSKPELIREDEKNFMMNRKKFTRFGYLSEEIDLDYEKMWKQTKRKPVSK